jgi:hypothetical protein
MRYYRNPKRLLVSLVLKTVITINDGGNVLKNTFELGAKEKPKQFQLFGLFKFISKTIKYANRFRALIDNNYLLSYVKNTDKSQSTKSQIIRS